MKIINFGMHGWVMGKATSVSEAHPFTMNLFDVYCRGEIVNDHSHRFLFVSPLLSHPVLVKGIVTDSNNIFLWHESEDINKKSLFPKFQLIPSLNF